MVIAFPPKSAHWPRYNTRKFRVLSWQRLQLTQAQKHLRRALVTYHSHIFMCLYQISQNLKLLLQIVLPHLPYPSLVLGRPRCVFQGMALLWSVLGRMESGVLAMLLCLQVLLLLLQNLLLLSLRLLHCPAMEAHSRGMACEAGFGIEAASSGTHSTGKAHQVAGRSKRITSGRQLVEISRVSTQWRWVARGLRCVCLILLLMVHGVRPALKAVHVVWRGHLHTGSRRQIRDGEIWQRSIVVLLLLRRRYLALLTPCRERGSCRES